MGIFEDIKLESQDHPSLTLASPFNILWEYDRGPQEKLKGDVHYALQISIVMQGAAEVVFRRLVPRVSERRTLVDHVLGASCIPSAVPA